MYNIKELQSVYGIFNPKDFPLLTKQKEKLRKEKSLLGYSIIHNCPLFMNCICKIEPLLLSGANVTVTNPNFCSPDKTAVDLLKRAGVEVELNKNNLKNSRFDFTLDTAADLKDIVNTTLGIVELTRTGAILYKEKKDIPILSVDNSRIKAIEDFYGTGESFIRALQFLTGKNVSDFSFLLFGFGKVGKGIAHHILKKTDNIYIVEKNPQVLKKALRKGLKGYLIDQKEDLESLLKMNKVDCVVTATGFENVISDHFSSDPFRGKVLANMGAEDEFGYKFNKSQCLNQKMPINFALNDPTKMMYLDPSLYAHNLGIFLILDGKIGNGLHEIPKSIDQEIFNFWCSYFKLDPSQVERDLNL